MLSPDGISQPLPTINGPHSVCLDVPISFSVAASPPGTTVHWEVENGAIINGNPGDRITVVFFSKADGPYRIRARSENRNGTSGWSERTIERIAVDFHINGPPDAKSSSYAQYRLEGTKADKYDWSIVPDHLGSVVDQDHSDEVKILWNNVDAPAVVTLRVKVDVCGWSYTVPYQVTVLPRTDAEPIVSMIKPKNTDPLTVAIIAPDEACAKTPIKFRANVNGGQDLSYKWDFGDRAYNSLPNPIKVFQNDDYPTVILTVTSRDGREATAYHPMLIKNVDMDGTLETVQQSNCSGERVVLTYFPNIKWTLPDFYHWHTDQGTITTKEPRLEVDRSGTYILDVETYGGCVIKRIGSAVVSFFDTPAATIIGPEQVGVGETFHLGSKQRNTGFNYIWTRDGQPQPQFEGRPSIACQESKAGIYRYGLTIVSGWGCSGSMELMVTVAPDSIEP